MNKLQPQDYQKFVDGLIEQSRLIRSFVNMADISDEQKGEALRLHDENEARLTAALQGIETADASNFDQRTRAFKSAFDQFFAHVKVMLREAIGAMRMFPPMLLQQFEKAIDDMQEKLNKMMND